VSRQYVRFSALFGALCVGATILPSSLYAQSGTDTDRDRSATEASAAKDPAPSAGPRIAPAGIARAVQTNPLGLARRANEAAHTGVGTNLGLMGLGAAAIATGAIIGGNGGSGVVVAGATVGLIGLYHFLF
jgi:hypothetical protein